MAIKAVLVNGDGDDQPRLEDLQELVLRRLAELGDTSGPMSAREAVRAAQGKVSYELIRMIARGVHGGAITDRVAEGLSLALRVPVDRVYRAAGIPTPGARWDWPERFSKIPGPQRAIVEDVAAAMLEMWDQGYRAARGED
jgi:hypothetical protein